ncbi:uncharacterized protein LOC111030837, partial [Myzus persicae]|uniref:uncharacterized protein LOC111030837 n=1 Tax=Myzus persicae TaxID=13164 RepID=UPI000B932149
MMKRKHELETYNYNLEVYRRKLLLLYISTLELKNKIPRSKPKWHVRPLLKERKTHGHYQSLTSGMQLMNSALYQNFIRMNSVTYEELVCEVGHKLERVPSRPDILSVGEILT